MHFKDYNKALLYMIKNLLKQKMWLIIAIKSWIAIMRRLRALKKALECEKQGRIITGLIKNFMLSLS